MGCKTPSPTEIEIFYNTNRESNSAAFATYATQLINPFLN